MLVMEDPAPTVSDRAVLGAAKPALTIHAVEAPNAETPAHLLDPDITPVALFFVRTNGRLPRLTCEADRWAVSVEGEVEHPLSLAVAQLNARYETHEVTAVLECAGNGRIYFEQQGLEFTWQPGTVAWGPGAVGCARFSGVRLADVLGDAGVTDRAVYVGFESPDRDVHADQPALSRGLPLWKALSPEVLIATHMNGEPLQYLHGAPLRIVAPGFPGSAWQKWLTRIWVRDCEHDGPKMTGTDYRMPRRRYLPGESVDHADFGVIEDLPAKTLVTAPADGTHVQAGVPFEVRGFAWSGHTPIDRVDISVDGANWLPTEFVPAADRFAWRRFRAEVTLSAAAAAKVSIIARATDAQGHVQPVDCAIWNPRGYLNDQAHRISVQVTAAR